MARTTSLMETIFATGEALQCMQCMQRAAALFRLSMDFGCFLRMPGDSTPCLLCLEPLANLAGAACCKTSPCYRQFVIVRTEE